MRIPFSRLRGALFLETRVPGTCYARRLPARDPLRTRAPFHARSRVNVRVKSGGERERGDVGETWRRSRRRSSGATRGETGGSGTVCHRGFLSVPKIPADSGKDKEKNGR